MADEQSALSTRLQCVAEDDTGHYPAAVKRLCAEAATAITHAEVVIGPMAEAFEKIHKAYRDGHAADADKYGIAVGTLRAAFEWQRSHAKRL